MRILVLGGTVFLGRHIVEQALARGHDVTLFNRGRNAEIFPEVEQLRGDRDSDLSALEGRSWDVAIDTCGYVPRVVRASAELLRDAVKRYIFISTISVYDDFSGSNVTEETRVGTLEDPSIEEVTGETYGPLKVLCEQAVQHVYGERATIVRPGLIVGPHDRSDRFGYWLRRLDRGGEILAPAPPERAVQFIDVRDLAAWTVELAERNVGGVFNATGPAVPLGELIATAQRAAGSDASVTWVDEEFLLEQEVGPWMELPLWIPSAEPSLLGLTSTSIERARSAGLRTTPLEQTVTESLDWERTRPADTEYRAGLAPDRERELLQRWNERTPSA